jgi:type IV pilus assembly protein PilM
MSFLTRQRPNVGLDVGSAFVRVVGLRRTREGWSLVAAGEAPRSPDDPGTDVRQAVQRLLDELKLRRVDVAVAVPAGVAIVRRLSLPADSLTDVPRHVGLEAEQHIPFAPDEASVSYQVLDRRRKAAGRSTDPDRLDVLLGAARRSEVAERTGVVAGRGRRVSVADVEGLALANAFTLNYPDQSDSALLLHIGHRSTVICVVERGELVATRGVSLGVEALEDTTELVAAIRQTAASENPGRLFLSGGGWQAEGLSARLGAALCAPVEALDPRRRIRTAATSRGADLVGPPFALAVGLALRRKGDA